MTKKLPLLKVSASPSEKGPYLVSSSSALQWGGSKGGWNWKDGRRQHFQRTTSTLYLEGWVWMDWKVVMGWIGIKLVVVVLAREVAQVAWVKKELAF